MNVPFRNSGGETLGRLIWWRVLLLIVVVGAVLGGLFWSGNAAYHAATNSDKPKVATNQSTQKPGEPEPKAAPSTPATPAKPSVASSSDTSSNHNSTLVNTGPGSTAALFTIATATGVIGYQIVLRRKVTN